VRCLRVRHFSELLREGALLKSLIRVLVVDDFEPWRSFYCSTLQKQPEFQVVSEASDGLEAVRQAQQLQPDLILLDIGLPSLNGIEAARQIRKVSTNSRILFVSENRSADIVSAALATGATGYVLKSDAALELLSAVTAALEGKRYVSASVAGDNAMRPLDSDTGSLLQPENSAPSNPPHRVRSVHHHEVGFYSEDGRLLDDLTQFVGTALNTGNAAIVIATDSHRTSLVPRLQAYGVDLDAAIEQGRYIALDAAETLAEFMVNDSPDPDRFLELVGDLIVAATEAAKGKQPCVSIFGECVNLLREQGNLEGAIRMEKLGNHLTNIHNVRILCGYSRGGSHKEMDGHFFRQVCAEHSAVYSQ